MKQIHKLRSLLDHFPSETSRDGASASGGAAQRVIGGGGRVCLGTCYRIRLPSPPPTHTHTHRGKQKVGLSLGRGSSDATTGRTQAHCRRVGSSELSGAAERPGGHGERQVLPCGVSGTSEQRRFH